MERKSYAVLRLEKEIMIHLQTCVLCREQVIGHTQDSLNIHNEFSLDKCIHVWCICEADVADFPHLKFQACPLCGAVKELKSKEVIK